MVLVYNQLKPVINDLKQDNYVGKKKKNPEIGSFL